MHFKKTAIAAALVAGMIPMASWATTGYFSLGYGAKARGMAGAGVAYPQDSLAASINPAGMAFVGDRADLGLEIFSPKRKGSLDPRVLGGEFEVGDESRRTLFPVPTFGYVKDMNPNLTFGVSIFGNGGMNSTYDRNIYDETFAVLGAFQQAFQQTLNATGDPNQAAAAGAAAAASVPEGTGTGLPHTGTLGVDLSQLIIAPTLAYKVNANHALGASLLLGVQRFSARGLGNFQCFTPTTAFDPVNGPACQQFGAPVDFSPGHVSNGLTNQGNSYAYGAGLRVGWTGKISPMVTLGATAATKVYMTEFDDYDELFADGGDFDIPANFAAGIALHPNDKLTLVFDAQRILYSDVDSITNPGPTPQEIQQGPTPDRLLGKGNGFGFGWDDITVYRLGVSYDVNPRLTLRAGFAYNDTPIPDSQILFNILAPAVIKRHVTLGFTFQPTPSSELSASYMHAFNEKQSDTTALGIPGSIEMYQNSVSVNYAWRF